MICSKRHNLTEKYRFFREKKKHSKLNCSFEEEHRNRSYYHIPCENKQTLLVITNDRILQPTQYFAGRPWNAVIFHSRKFSTTLNPTKNLDATLEALKIWLTTTNQKSFLISKILSFLNFYLFFFFFKYQSNPSIPSGEFNLKNPIWFSRNILGTNICIKIFPDMGLAPENKQCF